MLLLLHDWYQVLGTIQNSTMYDTWYRPPVLEYDTYCNDTKWGLP